MQVALYACRWLCMHAGGFVPGQGGAPPNHAPITFMVTNDCPIAGNEYWCGIYGAPGTSKTVVFSSVSHKPTVMYSLLSLSLCLCLSL